MAGNLDRNGHVYPEVDGKALGTSYREPKVVYYNLRDGTFDNITAHAGSVLSEPHSGRGMALGDLFNDGHLEALVNNMNEMPSLYYNTGPVENWITLQLVGVKSNRAALGTSVTLQQADDKRQQEVRSGDGYISQSDLRLHFGLGKSEKAKKLIIRWPAGSSKRFPTFQRITTTLCGRAGALTRAKLVNQLGASRIGEAQMSSSVFRTIELALRRVTHGDDCDRDQ